MDRLVIHLEQPGGFRFVASRLLQNLSKDLPLHSRDALLEDFLEGEVFP